MEYYNVIHRHKRAFVCQYKTRKRRLLNLIYKTKIDPNSTYGRYPIIRASDSVKSMCEAVMSYKYFIENLNINLSIWFEKEQQNVIKNRMQMKNEHPNYMHQILFPYAMHFLNYCILIFFIWTCYLLSSLVIHH